MTKTKTIRPATPEPSAALAIRLPVDLIRRLDDWRSRQAVPPSRLAVIRAAVARFADAMADVEIRVDCEAVQRLARQNPIR